MRTDIFGDVERTRSHQQNSNTRSRSLESAQANHEQRTFQHESIIVFEARAFCRIAISRCRGLVHQIPGLACPKRMGRQAGKSCQWNEAAFVTPQSTPGSMSWSPQCHQMSRNWTRLSVTDLSLINQPWCWNSNVGVVPCNPRRASILTSLPSTACVPGCRSRM